MRIPASRLALGICLLLGALGFAADKQWSGSISGEWWLPANWSGGAPANNDNAVFNSSFANQPTLTGAESAGGLWMTNGVGQNVTISGPGSLTLGGNTINGTPGLGILIDNASAFRLTINTALRISASQTWRNNSANLFTASAVDLGNRTLTIDGTGNTSIIGSISGTGGLVKAGSGTLFLSGANTFSGTVAINAGALNVQSASALGTTGSGTTVASGAALQLQGGITFNPEPLTLSGSGIGSTGALRNISGNNTYTGPITLAAASTIGSDANLLAIAGNIVANAFTTTFTGLGDISVSGAISGTGALVKNGSGTLTLSGTNSYNGGTTINAGTVAVSNNLNLGAATGGQVGVTVNGGTLRVTSGFATTRGMTMGGSNGTIQVDAGQTFAVNSSIAGPGALVKTGAGTLALGSNNNFGGARIDGGILSITADNRLGSGPTTINSGTLQINATFNTKRSFILGSTSSTFDIGAGHSFTLNSNFSGSGNLNKTGLGTMILGGNNLKFTGATNVQEGTLQITRQGKQLPIGSNLTVSGGTFDVQTFDEELGAVRLISGSIVGTGSGNLRGTSYAMESGLVTAILDGPAALTKTTAGTVTLTGVNTYSGGTTINAGNLAINNSSNLGAAGAITTINGGALELRPNQTMVTNRIFRLGNAESTFQIDGGATMNISSVIGNAATLGSLNKTGEGTLILSTAGANTYGGVGHTTSIEEGVLQVTRDNQLGNASNTVTFGGIGLGTLRIGGPGFTTARSVILEPGGTVDTNNNNASITGVISGSGVLTKTGAGTLTLTGFNTYGGGTFIIGGNNSILSVSTAANLGTGAVTISEGAVLATTANMTLPAGINLGVIGGNAQADGNAVSGIVNVLAGTKLTQNAGSVISGGRLMKDGLGTFELFGTNTYSGGTYLHNGTLIVHNANSLGVQSNVADPFSSALTIDNGATLRIGTSFVGYPGRGMLLGTGGAIFDIAAPLTHFNNGPVANVAGQTGGFTKTGTGTMGFGGTNTFIGDVRLNGGVLSISRDANLGAAANQIFMTGGTTLRVEDGVNNFGATPSTPTFATFTSARQFNLGAGNDIIEVKNFADTNPTFGVGGAPARPSPHLNTFTISGLITGAGTLVKEGDGKLTLSNVSNNYTGGTFVNAGTLSANSAGALGLNTTNLNINNNATFQATASFASSRAVLLGTTGGATGGVIDVTGANNFTQTGMISGGSLGKTGTGTLTLQGTNTFTGGLFINGGTVSAFSNASLGALTPTAGSSLYAIHMANGGTLATHFNSIGDHRQLELVSGISTLDVSTGFTQQRGALVYGAGGFVKTGNGTLILTNANTYTGNTTINGGTLQVNNTAGSATGNGNVSVNSGGTLSGLAAPGFANPGRISGNVAVNANGTLLARSGSTLTFGGLSLNAMSISNFQLGAPTAASIVNVSTANAFSITGSSTINISNIGGLVAGVYRLFDYNGTALADISDLQLGSTAGGGYFYSLSNNQTNTSIDLVISNVDNQWANDASGVWSEPTNWTNLIPPDAVGAQANFLGLINQARTATVDGTYTVGTITFDNLNSYTVAGDGVAGHGLILNNSGTAIINVLNGSHTITAPMTLVDGLSVFANVGTSLSLNGAIGESAAGKTLTLLGGGTMTLGGNTANTFTGLTTVTEGVLNLAKTAGVNAIGTGGLQIDLGATTNLLASHQISDAATVFVSGTFNLGANSDTIGALAGDGSVVTAAGGTLTIGSGTLSSEFDGVISGGGTIAKAGTGTLTLTAANTFGGAGRTVSLNAGRLVWAADNNVGNAANSVTFNGGALVFGDSFATNRSLVLNSVGTIDTNNNAATASGTISGAGSLAKIGTGVLTLTGSNTYSGGTSIAGGNSSVLSISQLSNLGTGGVSISGGSMLATTASMTLPNSISLGAIGGNLQLDGRAVSGILNVSAGTTLTQTAAGVISGGRLMKDGAGTLELFGANTYSGGTYLHNGTLVLNSSSSLGVQPNLADPFSAGLTIDNGATLRFASSFTGYPGRGIEIGTGGAVLEEYAGVTQFLNGPIVNVAGQGGGLTKTGAGTQGLGGTNTFAGHVFVNGGVLSISRDENLGAISNQLFLANGTTLRIEDGLNNYGATPASAVLATFASSRQFNLTGGNNTIEVKNFADTNLSFGVGGAPARPASHLNTFTIDGLLTGAGTLIKEGAGTLVVTNSSNNYTGGTVINAGTLTITNQAQLGLDSTGLAINNNAVFQANASFSSARVVTLGGTGGPAGVGGGTFDILSLYKETQSGVVQGAGSLSKTGTGTLVLNAANTYSGGTYVNAGTVEINSDASLGASNGSVSLGSATLRALNSISTSRNFTVSGASSTLQVDGNATYAVAGAIGGSGSLNKTGTGTLNLFGANTYTGATTISSGTVAINSATSLGSGAASLTVGAGTLDVVSTLTSSRGIVLADALSTIQVGAGQTFTTTGAISGSGGLVKSGAGTAVLNSAGTHTGSTRVNAGTLVAAASSGSALGSTSSVAVESGASLTLGANDQINNLASVVLGGGTLNAGGFSEGSASAVGMGTLELLADSKIDFGTGAVGTLAFAIFNPGAFTLTIDNWTGTANTVGNASSDRVIFNADPTASLLQFIFSGYDGAVAFDLGNGYYEVTPNFTPVPEINPTAIASVVCAVFGVFVHRRAVRRRAARK